MLLTESGLVLLSTAAAELLLAAELLQAAPALLLLLLLLLLLRVLPLSPLPCALPLPVAVLKSQSYTLLIHATTSR
jgi:hypothetical protein